MWKEHTKKKYWHSYRRARDNCGASGVLSEHALLQAVHKILAQLVRSHKIEKGSHKTVVDFLGCVGVCCGVLFSCSNYSKAVL